MKKTTVTMAMAGLLAVSAAQAAGPGTPMMMGPDMAPEVCADHMNERMGLDMTDAQKQQVRALMEEQRGKHDAIRAETHERMRAILTPEQARKFDAHQEQMKEVREDRREAREDRRKEYRDQCDRKPGKKDRKRFWQRDKSAE